MLARAIEPIGLTVEQQTEVINHFNYAYVAGWEEAISKLKSDLIIVNQTKIFDTIKAASEFTGLSEKRINTAIRKGTIINNFTFKKIKNGSNNNSDNHYSSD